VAGKILVVDDSTFIVDGLVAILKKKGYATIAAYGGDEALDILKKEAPDIIILDIMMEPMDGWETLEKIKGNPATASVPVLMFSAKKITPQEAENHRINIDDYVAKPVNPKALMESIEAVLARRNGLRVVVEKAKAAGVPGQIIDEYVTLKTSCEVDASLLQVLKNSSALGQPDPLTLQDQADAITRIETRLKEQEIRLKEITPLIDLSPV